MPRANRVFVPGLVWHITHRCHKKEFLLKFQRDRQRWRYWLFQAKQRYGLSVLNYIVTSNHIHLLVVDTDRNAISKSMQLIAGRTAQEFNQRKQRKGAFWEDRYHATAVDTDEHFVRCLVYIDLNMVRADAVRHPSKWCVSGYNEIQSPPQRYAIIDQTLLASLCRVSTPAQLPSEHQRWVESQLSSPSKLIKELCWTQSIAVGRDRFVADVKNRLGISARYRTMNESSSGVILKEPESLYGPF